MPDEYRLGSTLELLKASLLVRHPELELALTSRVDLQVSFKLLGKVVVGQGLHLGR